MSALRRRRGITLVELLVAMGLAVLIVGLVAVISTQVQRTVGAATVREDASRVARILLNDLERDLQGLLTQAAPPPPFTDPALRIARGVGPDGARIDRLTLLTSVRDPREGAVGTVRAYVTYDLGERAAPVGGGPLVGSLRRSVLLPGESGDGRVLPLDGQLVAFKVELQGRDGAFRDPDDDTATGEPFAALGKVDVAITPSGEVEVSGNDAGGRNLLLQVPIGAELQLSGAGLPAPRRTLVRKRSDVSPADPRVLVTDRLEPLSAASVSRFQPPEQLRVTLVLAFGKGPDQGTATFSRNLAVPR
jgi:type II secretory pathway pseudopilin PulG